MYRVSPFTYLIQGMLGVATARTNVVCSSIELLHVEPPSGSTCEAYMTQFISSYGGYLQDPSATSGCQFCSVRSTDVFLQSFGINYADRWRNYGLIWVFIVFNVAAAIGLYWLARVVSTSIRVLDMPD